MLLQRPLRIHKRSFQVKIRRTYSKKENFQLEGVTNKKILDFVAKYKELLKPEKVHLVTGDEQERKKLIDEMINAGSLIKLNEKKRPNSYLARSSTGDVARVEDRTYICSKTRGDAGPTNNWIEPQKMRNGLEILLKDAMSKRTMYVIPFCMGPLNSNLSEYGIQITDSPYVVLSMCVMARAGKKVLEEIEAKNRFVKCVHTLGFPLQPREVDSKWPCNPIKYITHFPEDREIISFGSGYGGNALLGKKCYALRIASVMARDNNWLAEHMLIMSVTNPEGKKKYIAAAFPSACGKTNLAMLQPTIPGWKVETVGDDICWMRFGKDGRLYAINPEFGFFGVAPGTSDSSNPIAMKTIARDTIFTNVALTKDGDAWWEDKDKEAPEGLTDWKGNPNWKPSEATPRAAHPNSRFCVPITNCPNLDSDWNNPKGVPIDAIIFGGRRSTTIPLVYESLDWNHGVFIGSSISSETTAANVGDRGTLRHDPFAMLPFCGYNMGDYFNHWLNIGKHKGAKLPKIFGVNWFRKENNKFLWPGFGENSRVIKWIFERCETPQKKEQNADNAVLTPIGYMPRVHDIDVKGLDISQKNLENLLSVDSKGWMKDAENLRTYYSQFGRSIPKKLLNELNALTERLDKQEKQ